MTHINKIYFSISYFLFVVKMEMLGVPLPAAL